MAEFLSPAYLETIATEADKLKSYETPVLNLFFKAKKFAPNGFVKVPKEVFNYDDILPLIKPGAAITSSELNMSRQYVTYELPMFGDMKILTPKDIRDYITQVAHLTGETFTQKKVEIATDIIGGFNDKVNATREYMACSALLGSIKDKDGNVIETFDIPAANKLGTKSVSDNTVLVSKLLRDMKTQMRKATKYKGRVACVLGSTAEEKIMASAEYKNWATGAASRNLTAEDQAMGITGYLGGSIPYIVIDDFYYAEGVQTSFFSEASIVMAPVDAFAEFYRSIDTNDGEFATIKHVDEFDQHNPDGTAKRLQCGAMPIVTLPNAIVSATLS